MAAQTTDSGLVYEDLQVGDGAEATGRGQTAVVHYTGWLEDGREFDSSVRRGERFLFPMCVGYVIDGWCEGVIGMRVGGRRRLVVPPALAYGDQGVGDLVPPGATLTFEIELLEISA